MKVRYRKKFLFELAKIPASKRKEIEGFVFEDFPANPSFKHWQNIMPLKYDNRFLKIPFHEYRIGLQLDGDELLFERIRHRDDIYKIQV